MDYYRFQTATMDVRWQWESCVPNLFQRNIVIWSFHSSIPHLNSFHAWITTDFKLQPWCSMTMRVVFRICFSESIFMAQGTYRVSKWTSNCDHDVQFNVFFFYLGRKTIISPGRDIYTYQIYTQYSYVQISIYKVLYTLDLKSSLVTPVKKLHLLQFLHININMHTREGKWERTLG